MFKVVVTIAALFGGAHTFAITDDHGGIVRDYQARYAAVPDDATIKIDGRCDSACTLALSTDYRFKVCATKRASLGFHKPFFIDVKTDEITYSDADKESADKTFAELFFDKMPSAIRAYLSTHRVPGVYDGDDRTDTLRLTAPEIWRYLPRCK